MNDTVLTYLLVFLLAWPLGIYMARVFRNERTFLDPIFGPLERGLYRLMGVNEHRGMDWRGYGRALLYSNFVLGVAAYLVYMAQGRLPLNPDGIAGMNWHTALHTVASFITNTNQQHYSGQSQLSYLSQLVGITALQVATPAVGLAVMFAILRGLQGGLNGPATAGGATGVGARDLGNYYVDTTRAITRVLLPLSLVLSLALTWQGVPSTFSGAKIVTPLQAITASSGPATQVIPVGPVAPMVAIKQLGTNGGGWYGPNSAAPLENPTPLSNLLSVIAIILLPVAQVFAAGFFLRKRRFAGMILVVMTVLSVGLTAGAILAERAPNAAFVGLAAAGPNLEGKEVRLGADATAAWAALSTQTSSGSVNGMLDSFTPLGGLIPMVGMFLNDVYGGIGVGLINMLLFVIVTVFIAGLMVGRTPELFGRKIEAREVKLASIALLLQPLLILGFTAAALGLPGGPGNSNPGYHGLSQVLYEYTSAFANNGSGFAGLGNTVPWWNVTCAIVLIFARFIPILAPLAIAGSLAAKRVSPVTAGTLRTDTPIFGVTLLSIMVLFQLLNFGPAVLLGPVGEQFSLAAAASPARTAVTAPAVHAAAPAASPASVAASSPARPPVVSPARAAVGTPLSLAVGGPR